MQGAAIVKTFRKDLGTASTDAASGSVALVFIPIKVLIFHISSSLITSF